MHIQKRPEDVIGEKCGNEIRMSCVAETKLVRKVNPTSAEIQWWFRNDSSSVMSSTELKKAMREQRVTIEVEEYLVVRSTLVIDDARATDEGVYQCRASNHPRRHKPGLQYWTIEEAPVADIICGEGREESIANVVESTTPITAAASSSGSTIHRVKSTHPFITEADSRPTPVTEKSRDLLKTKSTSTTTSLSINSRGTPNLNWTSLRSIRVERRDRVLTTPSGNGFSLHQHRTCIIHLVAVVTLIMMFGSA